MRIKSYILFAFVISLLGLFHGCTPGKHSFLIVQLCLEDERNLAEFTSMMQLIAQSERMNFVDGSAGTKRDLKAMGALRQSGPIIHMGVEREDGMSLIAGNIGLSGYQVAVGFSEGSDPSGAHAFADRVVSRLKTRWHVDTVPAGKGAFPLKTCERQSER
jgi:hypothetical protein